MLIRGGIVHDGLGHTFPADVRVESGLVAQVAPGLDPREGEEVVDATGTHVLPGFCQAVSSWGVNGSMTELRPSSQDNDEVSDPVTPYLDAFYAFNGRACSRQQLARFGVTCVGVTPTDNNVFGGLVAAFEVDGVNPYRMCLARDVAMMASVHAPHVKAAHREGPGAIQTRMEIHQRFSSLLDRAEAHAERRAAAAAAGEGGEKPDDVLDALARVTSGELPLWVSCDSACAVAHVREAVSRHPGVRLVLLNGYGLREDDADWLLEGDVAVVVRPGSSPSEKPSLDLDLAAVAGLVRRGARVVMGGESSHELNCREDMLWCAAMLMRELHDPDLVLPTVTSAPADLLGLGGVTGAVEPGRRADLALWSDDPLVTYQARLLRTLQAGRTVYREGDEHTWL